MIKTLKEVTDRIREEVKPKGNGEAGRRGWWDEECKKSKDKVKECINKWRKGEVEKGECNRKRREHEKRLNEKKQREKERYREEVEKAVREGRECEVHNTERGGRKGINEDIGMRERTTYFKALLDRVERRVKGEGRKEVEGDKDEGNGISREEVNEAIARMKGNKATGEDDMESEAVRYGGEGVRKAMWKVCNKVWRGEGWPEG